MPVWGFIGNIGTGKTMLMTCFGFLMHMENANIFSNYTLKGIKYDNLTSFEKLKESIDRKQNTCILADELWLSADGRKSQSIENQVFSTAIMQSRKWGEIGNEPYILYSTQDFIQCEKRIRHVTSRVFQSKIIRDVETNYPIALDVYYTDDVSDYNMVFPRKNNILMPLVWGANYIPDMYDTTQIVEKMETGGTEKRELIFKKYEGWHGSKARLKAVLIMDEGIPKTDAGILADYIIS